MNWQKGFNRLWLCVTALAGIIVFLTIWNENNFATYGVAAGVFMLLFGTTIAIAFIFFLGHFMNWVVRWIIRGYKSQKSDDDSYDFKP